MKLCKVSDGPFAYEPGRGASFNGAPIPGGLLAHLIIGACMSARGDVVRWDDLGVTTKAADKTANIRVTLHHLRKRLVKMGAPAGALQTVQGHGLRWDRTAMERDSNG